MATKQKRKRKLSKKLNKKALVIALIVVALVAVSLAVGLGTKKETIKETPQVLLAMEKDELVGVDVSEHNKSIDWSVLKSEVDFAIVRIGYTGYGDGKHYYDKRFEENLKGALENGVPVGVYYYSQAITPEEARSEARALLRAIRGYDIALPLFMDFEYASEKGGLTGRLLEAELSPSQHTEVINAFLATVKKAGYQCGVYGSSSVLMMDTKSKSIDKDAFIWVADYNKKLGYNGKYDIWQYTDEGVLEGNGSKHIDKNIWYIKD